MPDAPDPSVIELLRRDAFDELGRVAMLAEDYALKLFDASERRDLMAVAGRLQQFRLCTMAMIQIFNHFLRTQPHGEGMAAAEAGPPHAHRADQRSGDVVA
jgi:hypothetical protein